MSHIDAPAATEPVTERTTLRHWLAVLSVAAGTFLVVTAEQLPVGLLTSIGGDLGVSKGTAGLMVTVPGLVAGVSALLVPVVIGRLDRRLVLLGLISLMVAANVMSFLAPSSSRCWSPGSSSASASAGSGRSPPESPSASSPSPASGAPPRSRSAAPPPRTSSASRPEP